MLTPKNRTVKFFTLNSSIIFLAVFLCLPGSLAFAENPTAREIMEKVDAREDGDNSVSDMQMILIDKNGKKRERIMRSFGKDKGEDELGLIFFTAPATVKNTGFLTYDYDAADKDDDQWLYMPALKKTKRIAAADKDDPFMGSDFSYGDMGGWEIDNYTYKILKEDTVADSKVWLIQTAPKSQEVIDKFGYTKNILFIRQDNYVVVRAVSWLADSDKLKYMDVKKLEMIDDIWVATETHMTTKRGKKQVHKTILIQTDTKFNQDLSEDLFTVRQLEKGL